MLKAEDRPIVVGIEDALTAIEVVDRLVGVCDVGGNLEVDAVLAKLLVLEEVDIPATTA